MSVDIEIKVEPEFVRMTASGKYLFEELFEFITLLKREADRVRKSRALIDCRQFEGSMTEAERFAGGQYIAEVFGPHLKAVLLMPKGQVTKLGELTAVNRGAQLLVTECETEAVSWLIK
jgi:hypothetical protein